MNNKTFISLVILLNMAADLAVSGALAVLRDDYAVFVRSFTGWTVGLIAYVALYCLLRRKGARPADE